MIFFKSPKVFIVDVSLFTTELDTTSLINSFFLFSKSKFFNSERITAIALFAGFLTIFLEMLFIWTFTHPLESSKESSLTIVDDIS